MSAKKLIEERKLIKLLRVLSKEELKLFEKYVRSIYFNRNQKVIQLITFLKKYHPEYSITTQKVFVYLFGNKPFSNSTLNDVFNKSKVLLEHFLAQQKFEQTELLFNFTLLEQLVDKNAVWFFENAFPKVQELSKKQDVKNINYYQKRLELNELKLSYALHQDNRVGNSVLLKEMDELSEIIFIVRKLSHYCALMLRNLNTQRETWEVRFMEQIFEHLKQHLEQYPEEPKILIKVWYLVALLLSEPDHKNYFELKNHLTSHSAVVSREDLRSIYAIMLAYCNNQAQSGQGEYWKEIFDNYKVMLEKELLLVEGNIRPPIHFRNIVSIALLVGDYEWATSFIQKYEDYLPATSRAYMVVYCQANVDFYQKKYKDCIQKIKSFALQDDLNKISHKTLLVKAYYESEDHETLHKLLRNFTAFLDNHKKTLPDTPSSSYKNFIKISRQLLDFQENAIALSKSEKRDKQAKIQANIDALRPLTQQSWLEQKVAELY